jgi:hypothetical protein
VPQIGAKRVILHSWKEISSYLGFGIRTLQRYEVNLRLPVRRPAGKSRSAVLAFTDELDVWLQNAPTRFAFSANPNLTTGNEAPPSGRQKKNVVELQVTSSS